MLLLCSVTKNKKIMIDEKDVEVIPQEEMESLKGGVLGLYWRIWRIYLASGCPIIYPCKEDNCAQ